MGSKTKARSNESKVKAPSPTRSNVETFKKTKSKKQKLEQEPKSVILEEPQNQSPPTKQKKKSKTISNQERNDSETEQPPTKKKKSSKNDTLPLTPDQEITEETNIVAHSEETDAHELAVIKKKRKPRTVKSDKPKETLPQTPKLKKKSKKKRKKKEVQPKDVDYLKEKGIEYLNQWRDDREAWKFQKLRQIWLVDNMLDDSKISDELFPVFLDYVSGAQGQLVKVILQKANAAIKSMEDSEEVDVEDVKYQRSRKIIQCMGEDLE